MTVQESLAPQPADSPREACSPLRLRVRNFRSLRSLDWVADGVCLLVGANGAGKTTVLRALQFLRSLEMRGLSAAVNYVGGPYGLRHLLARDEPVSFELQLGELCWTLTLPIEPDGFVNPLFGERLSRGDQVVFDAPPLQPRYLLEGVERERSERCELSTFVTLTQAEWAREFEASIRALRVYDRWSTEAVLHPEAGDADDVFLHPSARNLIPVLRNWRGAARLYRGRFEWVLDTTRRAFPGLLDDLDFLPDGRAVFYPCNAGPDDKLPLHLAPDGLLIGLVILTAVVGAKEGSLLAIDEFENQLHPHAIRIILEALRELADRRNLSVLLTTHSPVVMNEFRREPESILVFDESVSSLPVPLTELHDRDWLAQFSLGDLFDRRRFGASLPGATERSGPPTDAER